MVEQAQACGEIRGDIDPEMVMTLVVGSLYFQWIVSRMPTSSTYPVEWIEQMIDIVIQDIGTK